MDAILFDLDGVIYQGGEPVPGALTALDWVRTQQIPHLFVTNTTSRPRSAICDKLATMGIHTEPSQILTPAVAARHWLESSSPGPIALFVPEATRSEFDGLAAWDGNPEIPVTAVIVGDLGEQWDFNRLNTAFTCLMGEPRPALIALGMTRYWQAEDGLRLDTGPFVAALHYATGIEPRVMGKPAGDFFLGGIERLGTAPARTLMIGDDIRGDIEGALQAGLQTALVRTGKFRETDLELNIRPDTVLGSIAELPRWWDETHS